MNKKLALKKALTLSMALLFAMSCKSEDKNKGTTQKLGIIYLWQSQMCAKNNPFPNGGSVTSAVNVSPSPASGSDYNYGYINAGGADYVIHKKTIQKISSTGALSDFVGSTSSTASSFGSSIFLQFDSSGNAYFNGSVGNDSGIVKADSSGNTTMLLRATSAIGIACNTPGYGATGINIKSTGEIQGYGGMAGSYYGLSAAVDYTKYYLFTYKQP